MGYSANDSDVRVDIFKASGKWYQTIAISMGMVYHHPELKDAFVEAYEAQVGPIQQDMIYVCNEPYHQHAHPIMIKG